MTLLSRLHAFTQRRKPQQQVVWRKSSRSNGNGGNNCVEVADLGDASAVRDSKDPDGPQLLFDTAEWQRWLGLVKADGYDR
jgi:hypothetical protein